MNNNKLIAEFMGLPLVPCSIGTENGMVCEGYQHPKGDTPFTADGLQYKYSWDWLMPVVIECFNRFANTDTIDHMKLNDALLTCNINELHEAVVDFIRQHNDER